MTLGDLIKSYRNTHGMTMQEFANLSGLSKAYVSMLEKNRHPQNNKEIIPSIDTFNKVALAMKLSLNDLLEAVNSDQLINLEHIEYHTEEVPSYTTEETSLIDKYRALNEAGQDKVNDYIDDLASSEKYRKSGASSSNAPSYDPSDRNASEVLRNINGSKIKSAL